MESKSDINKKVLSGNKGLEALKRIRKKETEGKRKKYKNLSEGKTVNLRPN